MRRRKRRKKKSLVKVRQIDLSFLSARRQGKLNCVFAMQNKKDFPWKTSPFTFVLLSFLRELLSMEALVWSFWIQKIFPPRAVAALVPTQYASHIPCQHVQLPAL